MPVPFARPLTHHLPALRRLTVARVAHVTPAFVRVTLVGEGLDDFDARGPDDHVKVFFPDPATGVVTVPQPRAGGPQHPEAAPVFARDYTPRAHRAGGRGAVAELDLDLLLHGDGLASGWAAGAQPGDALVVGGPRASKGLPESAESVVLLGDESALPAIARWLELLPAHVAVAALIDVADPRARSYLPDELRRRADILWLSREHGEGQLVAALRGLGPIDATTYVFGAGEASALIPLRQYLRKELALPAGQVALSGYWKAGQAGEAG